ncbi:MAG: hypothetical protein AAB591_00445, partial [Patescibacteria group bacterium]
MAKKRKEKTRNGIQGERARQRWHDGLAPDTKQSIVAVVFFALAAITLLAYWGRAGSFGKLISSAITAAVGSAYPVAPITFALIGFSFLFGHRRRMVAPTLIGGALFLVSSLALVDLFFGDRSGGWIGLAANWPIVTTLDFWAALVIELALFTVAILIMANVPLLRRLKEEQTEEGQAEP